MDEDTINQMSDEELYSSLKEFRPDLGPVVDSTRSLYKRLLLKAIQGDPEASLILNGPNDGTPTASPEGRQRPVTRSSAQEPSVYDQDTEEDVTTEEGEPMDGENDDEFEILNEDELNEDINQQIINTEASETNHFLVRAVVIGFIVSIIAIVAVAIWMPPSRKY